MTDQEYLASLKAGDAVWQVAYHEYVGGVCSVSKATVARITPTGQITLDNGDRFKPNGFEIGYNFKGKIVTQEKADKARIEIREVKLCAAVSDAVKQIRLGSRQRLTQGQHDKAMALIEQLKEVLA